MRRTSWIWLAGTFAWLIDALVCVHFRAVQRAELALMLTVTFFIAWLFFRQQPR